MVLKFYKPVTPASRKTSVVDFRELTKQKPEKKLTLAQKSQAGRNRQGKITVRRRGGGAKRHYRIVDFGFTGKAAKLKVLALNYDPNRSAHLALVCDEQGKKKYILAPHDLKIGMEVEIAKQAKIKVGNRLHLRYIPIGTEVFNIELHPEGDRGGKVARSAGAYVTVLAKEGDQVHLKLSSGEVRIFHGDCFATVGKVSNLDHENVRLGKAGRTRHKGKRPAVRGKAMNPVDHPHGGGEGGSPIGLKHPKTPQGRAALGRRTRTRAKKSNRYIVKRRTGEKVSNL